MMPRSGLILTNATGKKTGTLRLRRDGLFGKIWKMAASEQPFSETTAENLAIELANRS